MRIRHRLPVATLVTLAFLSLLSRVTTAQSLTGALVSTGEDSQGGVLPAAVVQFLDPRRIMLGVRLNLGR